MADLHSALPGSADVILILWSSPTTVAPGLYHKNSGGPLAVTISCSDITDLVHPLPVPAVIQHAVWLYLWFTLNYVIMSSVLCAGQSGSPGPLDEGWCGLSWTPWTPLERQAVRHTTPTLPGVYRVRRDTE